MCVHFQVEKQRADLARELDDMTDRLEEAGGATASQVCLTKTNASTPVVSVRKFHFVCSLEKSYCLIFLPSKTSLKINLILRIKQVMISNRDLFVT